MKKIIALILAVALIAALAVGCNKPTVEAVDTKIITLKGPTGIGMAKMMEDAKADQNSKYTFSVVGDPTEVVAAISSKKADIAALPTNLAATLYKRTEKGIKMIAINTLGSLYILENGNTINSFEDLRGKTIYATGQGANPEYVLNYLLEKNGLEVGKDVTVEFKSEHTELATLLATNEVAIGMLPEPNVTSAMVQNKELRIALNLNEEWNKVADENSKLTMGCVVVRTEFLEQYPEQVELFIKQLGESINYAKENTAEAGALCEAHGIVPKAAIATKAIPNCNLTLVSGADMKPAIEDYFNLLHTANPTSVGGAVPDEAFYFVP